MGPWSCDPLVVHLIDEQVMLLPAVFCLLLEGPGLENEQRVLLGGVSHSELRQ